MKKRFILFFSVCAILFLTHCGKNKNTQLAHTYYKLSLLELDQQVSSHSDTSLVRYKNALSYVNQALEQDVTAEYLALKATILFKLNNIAEGNRYFELALKQPACPQVKTEIKNNQACLLAQIGITSNDDAKIDEAMVMWYALQEDKNYLTPEVALFNQSKIHVFREQLEPAKEKLLKAVGLASNYVDAHYYLAVICNSLHDRALAQKHTDIVLFLDGEHEGACQLQELLQK